MTMKEVQRRKTLRYEPHFVDLSDFPLIATYSDDEMKFLGPNTTDGEIDIYVIQMDDEMYVGSTGNVKDRMNAHLCELRKGNHYAKRMQEVFNEKRYFSVFRIMRCYDRGLTVAEDLVARLLQPSLNTFAVTKEGVIQNEIVWIYETEHDREHLRSVDNAIICPSCKSMLRFTISSETNKYAKTMLRK